jgi:hypothetical protein
MSTAGRVQNNDEYDTEVNKTAKELFQNTNIFYDIVIYTVYITQSAKCPENSANTHL